MMIGLARKMVSMGLLVLAAPALSAAETAPGISLSELGWLVGTWVYDDGTFNSKHVWMPAKGQVMLATQRDRRDGRTRHVEFIQLREAADGVVFHVYPIGQQPSDFHLVWADQRRVVFENPDHDFPQRILYWIENGKTLVSRVEGKVDGEMRGSE